MSVHLTQALADGLDVALLAAAIAVFALRRSHQAAVTGLLAAAPLWSLAAAMLHLTELGRTPIQQAVTVIAAHLPLWAAFILGLSRLLGSAPAPVRPDKRGVRE